MLLATAEELEVAERRIEALENELREERARKDESVQAQRIQQLENDVRRLVWLIKRAQAEGMWRVDGMQLQDQQFRDTFSAGNK